MGSLLAVGALMASTPDSSAALLISESFDYPAGNLQGNTGGTGWAGSWSATDTDGTATVLGSSLTFSDMPVVGGAAELQITNNNSGFVDMAANRLVGVQAPTGEDLWVSFLYRQPGAPLAANTSRAAELRHGPNLHMRIKAKNGSSQGVALAYDSTFQSNGTKNIQDGATYLIVARFGDVDQATGKVALMWVLDAAGYDSIKFSDVTQAGLDTANILSLSDAHANETLGFGQTVQLVLGDSSGTSFAAQYDELKYGTAVTDVIAVPNFTLTGDLDGDGFVGITDLNVVLGNWNLNVPPADPRADTSGDLFVGIEDLNTVLGNWNAGVPPAGGAAVPEPASALLVGAGVLSLMLRQRMSRNS